jgi:hypothetical protein
MLVSSQLAILHVGQTCRHEVFDSSGPVLHLPFLVAGGMVTPNREMVASAISVPQ